MTESETPRRLVSADYARMQHDALLAALTRTAEPYVTVEFTRNAKGETQISTKVSAPGGVDQDELARLSDRAMIAAQAVYDESCAKYPTGTGFVRNEGQSA